MASRNQLFAAAAACSLAISTIHLLAQQPRYDGAIPGEPPYNGPNQAERAAARARGFNRRDRRLLYVALPGGSAGGQFSSEMNGLGIVVLDVDRNFEFVKRIPTYNIAAAVRPAEAAGIAASPATNMIYLAMRGRLTAFDLATDQKVWDNTYDGFCCERQEITPDGLTIVAGSNLRNFWYVIDARSGEMKGKIQAAATDAHNMALSADGKTVLMAPNGVTVTVGDVPSMKAIRTITFSDHVRPLVINHDATRVYANLNNLLGFEIADVKTGEVIKRIEAPAEMWKEKWANRDKPGVRFFGHGCPSHGIALTPDESELWVVDNINYGVLVYDNTGEWPVYRSTFPTTASADWITMGLDGRYAYLSSADIVDVKTKKIVGQMKDEYGRPMHSEKFLELAFRETPGKEYGTEGEVKLVRTVSQFGQGIPSAVQARLAAKNKQAASSK
jgi:DNA-binding beta-propeller fold protein YncE